EVTETDAASVQSRAEAGDARLGIIIPEGFSRGVMNGEPSEIKASEGEGAGIESDVVISVVKGFLDRADASSVAAAAGSRLGAAPAEVGAIAQQVATGTPPVTLAQGQASDEQLDPKGALVAGQAGLFLMFTVSFGVLGLLEERENGTLPRLRSMPMKGYLIVLSKVLSRFVLAAVASATLLQAGGTRCDVAVGSPWH